MARIVEEAEESSTTPNKIRDRSKRQSWKDSERSATDKSWRIVFFIVFIIWFIVAISIGYQRNTITVSAENSTKSHNSSELAAPFYLWGRHWTFDTITCNLAYLQIHYDESGVIVIATNLLFSIVLLIYAIGPMRTDDLFHGQLDKAAVWFALIFLCYRLLSMAIDKVDWWPIPEAIFFMLWYTKRHCVDKENQEFLEEQLNLHAFNKLQILSSLAACELAFFPVICMWCVLDLYGWQSSALSYVIIAASFYLALTVHYLYLMMIARTVDYRFDEVPVDDIVDDDYLDKRDVHCCKSVLRHHVGTACYHATLIFPRLKALAVMNEVEFKDMLSDEKFVDRLALTQSKLHDLTPMATAVAGTDHAESLRELLRHWHTADSPDLKYFQGYAQVFRSSLALLLSTNNLMTLFLWFHGAHDPHTVLATWKFYLLSILTFGIAMRNYDVITDTILLHSKDLPIENDSVPDFSDSNDLE